MKPPAVAIRIPWKTTRLTIAPAASGPEQRVSVQRVSGGASIWQLTNPLERIGIMPRDEGQTIQGSRNRAFECGMGVPPFIAVKLTSG